MTGKALIETDRGGKAATKLSVASLKRPPHICWPWLLEEGLGFAAFVLKSAEEIELSGIGLLEFEELAFISV